MIDYWEYFRLIEDDFLACRRFVEFDKINWQTYSEEFAKIIIIASTECEAVMKDICTQIEPTEKPGNINEYYRIITKKFPDIIKYPITVKIINEKMTPFNDWSSQSGPNWWSKCYTKIKHNRAKSIQLATLENAFFAISALLCIVLHNSGLKKQNFKIDIFESPKLFFPITTLPIEEEGFKYVYQLPRPI